MGRVGDAVVESIVYNYGKSEVLTRMSDPNWFQALGALMGMHWNSSGVTAVVMGSLKPHINRKASDLGLYILGGKGKQMQYTNRQIDRVSDRHGLPGTELAKSARLTRRIDNNAIQDGFDLYQQYFLLSDEGEWTAISQGMNRSNRRARRYHWHSPTVRSFGDSPHTGIAGLEQQRILNLTDPQADMLRSNMVSLTKEKPRHVQQAIREAELPNRHDVRKEDVNLARLGSVLDLAYNRDIEKFEDLVDLQGVGPRTLKALAMASEVIHGDATDRDLLLEENIEQCDAFCALTNDDEVNIMSSLMAKRLGVRQVITLITKPAYVDLVQGGEIDVAISPQQATISTVLSYVRRADVARVHSLRRGAAEAMEAIAHGDAKSSKVVGRKINEIKLPSGVTIGAIVRGDDVLIAHDDVIVVSDDHVILFMVDKSQIRAVERLFQVGLTFF